MTKREERHLRKVARGLIALYTMTGEKLSPENADEYAVNLNSFCKALKQIRERIEK